MPDATPSDVKHVIDTSLTDSEITAFLEDAEYDAQEAIANYDTNLSATDRTQIEKYYAALLIRTTKEKGLTSQSGESRNLSYEDIVTAEELRQMVDKKDPSGTLAQSALRDTDRYVGSTSE